VTHALFQTDIFYSLIEARQALFACSIRSGLCIALTSLSTASSELTRVGDEV